MKIDDMSLLPPKYQEQVRRKLIEKGRINGTEKESSQRTRYQTQAGHENLMLNANSPFPDPIGDKPKGSKYHSTKTTVDGICFDSKKEARRFETLREMERCGKISDLRLQVNFTLIEGYTKLDGERVRPTVYRADFTYQKPDQNGTYTIYIVEDTKSRATRTETYLLKKKLMWEKFHIEITEV